MSDSPPLTFEIGLAIYLKGRDEPLNTMMVVQQSGLFEPSEETPPIPVIVEQYLWDMRNDRSQEWIAIENKVGDRLLIFSDQIDAIRIIAPPREEDSE